MTGKAQPSLRAVLARKRVREAVYRIAIEDSSRAQERYNWARARSLMAGTGKDKDDPEARAAQDDLDAAQAALDACFYPLRFRALSRADYDAILSAEGQDDNDVAFRKLLPPLAAACQVDGDLSADEWAAELASDRWSAGDVVALWKTLVELNGVAINDGLPKD